MSEEIIVSVEHLSKCYKLYNKPVERMKEALSLTRKCYHRDYYALSDISFKVYRGETLGIIGTNGSGKSTLLKLLTRVIVPTDGNLEVKGKISALLELGAGFNPEYSGLENIYLNGTMMDFSHAEMQPRVKGILEFADIGDFINQPTKTYSSGMFARLAFAVAINVEPDVLIVDEALAVGDMRFQMKCMDRMKEMMENGTTILFVSHDIASVRRFCSRAIWLHQGKLCASGETNEVADRYMDFLKCNDLEMVIQRETKGHTQELEPFQAVQGGEQIASIVHFEICGRSEELGGEFSYSEPVTVTVVYDVYDEAVVAPVLGVAIFSLDDEYICGLNTLLDKINIPWCYGRNSFSIQYPNGLRLIGGKYYFDATIRDKTATVNIDYKKCIQEIIVTGDYVAEGKLVIPHIWQGSTHMA